jgi:GNAT superfamily N-acetyltransferase
VTLRREEGNFEAFFRCPFDIYPPSSPYVSPLKGDLQRFLDHARNPLLEQGGYLQYFTVHEGDRVLGRLVAHNHPASDKRHGLRRGCFGFFDCCDRLDVAALLLEAAESLAREHGCNELLGNVNLTAMQQMGVMTEGFARLPYIDQVYSPPWLPGLLERCGYRPEFGMTTFELRLAEARTDALHQAAEAATVRQRNVRLLPVRWWQFRQQMRDTCDILNAGFAQNPLFVPLTHAEFWFQAGEMLWIMDRHISLIAEVDGQPAAVVVCIPDLNPLLRATGSRLHWTTPWHYLRHRLRRDRAVVIFYSVVPSAQGQGLNSLLLHELLQRLKQRGYRSLGVTWIGDSNHASLRQMHKIGAEPLHRLHLFRKPLDRQPEEHTHG